jgi:hypothetical protein
MCLLCEELWMPFELPPQAKARTFVVDSPKPDSAPSPINQAATPSTPKSSEDDSG